MTEPLDPREIRRMEIIDRALRNAKPRPKPRTDWSGVFCIACFMLALGLAAAILIAPEWLYALIYGSGA